MGRTRSGGSKYDKKKTKPLYSTGERNRMIDSAVHPLSRMHPAFALIDGLLHALVEQDLRVSLPKFVKYSLPELIRMLLEDEA